jgi:hypothetical protein
VSDKKLTNLDEGRIQDIIGELEDDETEEDKENSNDATTTTAAALQKAKHRVQLRLAMEKKAEARKASGKKGGVVDDNDDVADLTAFAKNATTTKSKKK